MSGKFALVIGNTEYIDPGLAQLTAPGKDAEDFARVLRDPDICAFDNVITLLNQPSSDVIEAIDEFFDQKKPDDLLVLYFSGHGVRDELGALYLAVKNTNRSRLRSTAIKSDYIREGLDQSRSRRQILILDCSNSGAFAQGTKYATGVSIGTASAFEGGYGRIILTASDSTQFAWEGDKVIGETDNSLFTHFLIEGLEGEADLDGDGRITVDELYDYAYEKVRLATPKQAPSKFSSKGQGEIVLRQSMRIEDIKPVPLSAELMNEIEDTRPYVREAAVQKLERILKAKNIGLARSAIEALEKIATEDDSRRVAQAAAKALESIRPAGGQEAQKADGGQPSSSTRTAQLRREKTELEARFKAEQEMLLKEKSELEERLKEEQIAREKAQQLAARKAETKKPARDGAEAPHGAPRLTVFEQIAVAAATLIGFVGSGIAKLKSEPSAVQKAEEREARRNNLTAKFKISIAYPEQLSKRFESTFLFQLYLPDYRSQADKNIKTEFPNQKSVEPDNPYSNVVSGQKVRIQVFSPRFTFSEPVIKTINSPVNKIAFLGVPNDDCEPGSHRIQITIVDARSSEEIDSMTISVKVVDFAFDHVSRPSLSRVSAVVLGIGSFAMFILTFLEQIDKTVGLTSGTAAGVLAAMVYANFYNLYQRIRPNMP